MNLQFRYEDFHHVSTTMITLVNYIIFGLVLYWVYKTNDLKPKLWKAFLAMFLGLFVFSINFNFDQSYIEIPILPLGVWILLWICSRKNNQTRWAKYRRFAWAGFILRFIYLITTLLIQPIISFF
ncbi:hypothetical protein [Gottfriedia luciferensis]|uniref:hypothetical protein n=1 Tax=Gottfriedia luciferensis TaxID=178774 RepID=UPI000B449C38|nr:hypothetical protein [Gottfriedia luciferensis]